MNDIISTDCPPWCTGGMHGDGLPDHDATIAVTTGLAHIDLVALGTDAHTALWFRGNVLEDPIPADPAVLRALAAMFTEAADRLEDIRDSYAAESDPS